MRLHILGIGGTFMAGLAVLARDLGHSVTGSDAKVYPPMSTQLEAQGIALMEGYDPAHLDAAKPDLVIIGNALSRGNALVEAVLDRGLPYTSGAQWIGEQVLAGRWVIAVAGTHGKTTTSSMVTWILEQAGLQPGFLIGGVPENFGVSARLGQNPFFVIEADEYDTDFFDKRSKFVHYRARTAILNNLEYDHADIFPDLAAIQQQFHHFVRIVPSSGLIVANAVDPAIAKVLTLGCWTPVEYFGAGGDAQGRASVTGVPAGEANTARGTLGATWKATPLNPDASRFEVAYAGTSQGVASWALMGEHNMQNALAAVAAARHAGVPVAQALAALASFRNVKRRLEVRGTVNGVTVYDDFAHHPTAIAATLAALRARVGKARILAVLEPRSNTMKLGVHRDTLGPSLTAADRVYLYRPPDLGWDLSCVTQQLNARAQTHDTVEGLVRALAAEARAGDHVLVMSNGGFENIHPRLLAVLAEPSVAKPVRHS
ncbi:MAG TPA: UDP-N-acetylmuramate:L-alanyl-gamma-D-glutamyl-meso-diaminopimelate ligase [Burkholderiales bacterium]|nr:UDP-N-acetylmuramate:L-alanyl-gamma-D-glutamyl-meso-diaminopimelate ligase [Burkholderiales bacterium]